MSSVPRTSFLFYFFNFYFIFDYIQFNSIFLFPLYIANTKTFFLWIFQKHVARTKIKIKNHLIYIQKFVFYSLFLVQIDCGCLFVCLFDLTFQWFLFATTLFLMIIIVKCLHFLRIVFRVSLFQHCFLDNLHHIFVFQNMI